MYINERARRIREIGTANGWNPPTKKDWGDGQTQIPCLLALIHSEINEAHDELLAERLNELAFEFADIEIRILDLCGGLVGDFEACVAFAWETGVNVPDDFDRAFIDMHKWVTTAFEHYREDEIGLFIGALAKLYLFNRCLTIHKLMLNLDKAVGEKLEKNAQRSHRHGGKFV